MTDPQPSEDTKVTQAAEAAEAEATGRRKTVTFGDGDDAITLEIPRKWKRFKFLRALGRGDIGAALEAIWQPIPDEKGELQTHPSVLALEEVDIDEDDFKIVLEALGEALGGTDAGNSSRSQT